MKLDAPLIRLPYRFDAAAATEAALTLPDSAWRGAPDSEGIRRLRLVAPDGDAGNTARSGRLQATEHLRESPLLAGLLTAPGAVVGRSELWRLSAGSTTPTRHDLDAYWQERVRLLFILGEGITLGAGDLTLDAPAGTAWLIDGWRGWRLAAGGDRPGLVLAVDTVGSATFWSQAAAADRPRAGDEADGMSPRSLALRADAGLLDRLETETAAAPRLRSAAELGELVRTALAEMRESDSGPAAAVDRLQAALDSFLRQWQAILARHGDTEDARAACRRALEQAWPQVVQFAHPWPLANGATALERFHALVFSSAVYDTEGRSETVIPVAQLDALLGRRAAPARTADAASATSAPAGGADETRAAAEESGDNDGRAAASGDEAPGASDPNAALRSVHTRSFPELLRKLGASLLVTTYQAGKLAILREADGLINTHFRVYNRPMGLATDGGRLAVGTAWAVEEYRNMADVAARLEPPGRHDAAFLPRNVQVTGNIDIHEMAYGDEGLWLVNTRFSCLCTLDGEHSFVPRWRPGFVSGYAPEDRCHLNGLEIVEGRPKYVTALGETDTAGGWRDNKAGGGVLIDVDSGEIICRGLSMPHSPRWHDGKLWVLESGNGSLAAVDPASGRVDTVVELPGFTRGLDFYGPFAFIGLSQVRESAVFSGIRLTERVDERDCGVWVVDLRSARVIAFLKFEDAVQEVFAVSVLPGQRYPDVLATDDPRVPVSYALPDSALAEVVRPEEDS